MVGKLCACSNVTRPGAVISSELASFSSVSGSDQEGRGLGFTVDSSPDRKVIGKDRNDCENNRREGLIG